MASNPEQLMQHMFKTFDWWIERGNWQFTSMRKGRPSNRRALTPIQVHAIRRSQLRPAELAKIFDITETAVYLIKKHITYN